MGPIFATIWSAEYLPKSDTKLEDKYRDKSSTSASTKYFLCFFVTSALAKEYLEEYEYLEADLNPAERVPEKNPSASF